MEELKDYRNVPINIAAKLLDVSPNYIRVGLQRNRLPFGTAVQISNERWTYQISPGLLTEYITGATSLKKYFDEHREMLKAILEEK